MIKEVTMGKSRRQWMDGKTISVTFCVTQDCNLACTYCYMVGKNSEKRMSYDTATKIVDFVLENEYLCRNEAVTWDFIGGEPLLEMDMISKLCDYIVLKMYAMNHKWFNHYMFSFSTNGILYGKENVQKFIARHYGHASFGLSVDGTKKKHDLSRIYKNGGGSYDDVVRNVPLWISQYPFASTKATFASDDLPFLKDSVIHLWDLGIKDVMSNVVYENVWKDGDDKVFEEQLKALADYIIENEIWDKYHTSFFDSKVGLPVNIEELGKGRCGAGYRSVAFDSEGNAYPCIRFLELCFSGKKKIIVGNINDGLNMDVLRAFCSVTWKSQSPHDCNTCVVGSNCGWCIGLNYDESEHNTINERTTHICKMHKANARATQYFWAEYSKKTGKTSPRVAYKMQMKGVDAIKYMYFISSDRVVPHCGYINNNYLNNKQGEGEMPAHVLNQGLEYCLNNDIVPVFLGKCNHGLTKTKNIFYKISNSKDTEAADDSIIVYDNCADGSLISSDPAIVLINKDNVRQLSEIVMTLLISHNRVNIFIQDMFMWDSKTINDYEAQINILVSYLSEVMQTDFRSINILTDLFDVKGSSDCGAGLSSLALAPNGKIYACPAFYFDNPENSIGDLFVGQSKSARDLLKREKSFLCSQCEIHTCPRCLYINKKLTGEYNTPPKIQCELSFINAKASNRLRDLYIKKGILEKSSVNTTDIGAFDDVLDIAMRQFYV